MTSNTLRSRAQAAATTTDPTVGTEPTADETAPTSELAPFADLPEPTGDPDMAVSVFVAWNRVMRDVAAIGKKQVADTGRGGRYNFRGVDAVVNAFGPAVRRHGVIVVPTKVTPAHRDAKSANDKAMRETTTIVDFRVYGPAGDWFEGQAEGESLDVSDKGTAKAQSIAERVFLLVTGMVPTDEQDPDRVQHERGERPTPRANDYRDEIVDHSTSLGRLRQIRSEISQHRIGDQLVINEVGDDERLLDLLDRTGRARRSSEPKES